VNPVWGKPGQSRKGATAGTKDGATRREVNPPIGERGNVAEGDGAAAALSPIEGKKSSEARRRIPATVVRAATALDERFF
jgi:hypothetical protein